MRTKNCKACGRRFVSGAKSRAQYCSQLCRSNSRSTNPAKYYHHGTYLCKSGRREHYDSGMEHRHMLLLDAKGVNWCRASGIKISYFNPNLRRQATYEPDFVIKSPSGYIIQELKPYSMVNLPINQAKFEAARRWCRQNGYHFVVITEPGQV